MIDFINHHSGYFWGKCFWGECNKKSAPKIDVYSLVPTQISTQKNCPNIDTLISTQSDCLQLSFIIENNDLFSDFANHLTHLKRDDFLWENNCLECFFEFGDEKYFELNFSPAGKFALYEFDDYRTPNHLPPKQASGSVFANFDQSLSGFMTYHIGVKLDNIQTFKNIKKINPTAIIYKDGTPIFYAVNHATPPNFHHKDFWISMS